MNNQVNTLEQSIDLATDIINRLGFAAEHVNNDDETKAIYKMKAQVEIIVTDLTALFALTTQDLDEIANLQAVLQKMDGISRNMIA